MKQKIYKAPKNLKEKVDKKIAIIEGMIQMGELVGKNFPFAIGKMIKEEKKINKKR